MGMHDKVTQIGLDVRITELFTNHPDHDCFGSLPGAGPKIAPRLLGELGNDRTVFQSHESLQLYVAKISTIPLYKRENISPGVRGRGGKARSPQRSATPDASIKCSKRLSFSRGGREIADGEREGI
jgi:hypothetical protein